MKTITLTVSNRPQYLKQFLYNLSKCEEIDKYKLIIGIEPLCKLSKQMCEDISFIDTELIYNKTVLGVKQNPYNLLCNVFEYSNFNIYLEEDTLVSNDVLLMSDYYYNNRLYEKYPILCLSNFESLDYINNVDEFEEMSTKKFTPFSWATVKNNWIENMSKWWNIENVGWDFNITSNLNYNLLLPVCSRCNHIGEYGVHMVPEYHVKTYALHSYYKGNPIKKFKIR